MHFPVWEGRTGFVVDEVARRSGDFALTGVVCGVELDDAGAVRRSAIAFFGMAPTPVRGRRPRRRSTGSTPGDGRPRARSRSSRSPTANPTDDVHASAEYRKHVGAHLAERALDRALGEARSG